MRKTTFKRFLAETEADDLRSELERLYDVYPEIKQHYTMELGDEADRTKVFAKAKKDLAKLYERWKSRARKTRAAAILKQVDRISVFDHELADLYIFHAEQCLQWMRWFDVRPLVFTHFMSSLDRGLNLVLASQSEEDFRSRIYDIVDHADVGYDTVEPIMDLVEGVLGDDYLAS